MNVCGMVPIGWAGVFSAPLRTPPGSNLARRSMHGSEAEESDHHVCGHRVDPHPYDVSASAVDAIGDRGAVHRGLRGRRRNHSSPRAQSRGRQPDAEPGRLHGVPAPHQAKLQGGGQHHHRRRPRDDARGAARRRDAHEAGDELAQHGLDELRALSDARPLLRSSSTSGSESISRTAATSSSGTRSRTSNTSCAISARRMAPASSSNATMSGTSTISPTSSTAGWSSRPCSCRPSSGSSAVSARTRKTSCT